MPKAKALVEIVCARYVKTEFTFLGCGTRGSRNGTGSSDQRVWSEGDACWVA